MPLEMRVPRPLMMGLPKELVSPFCKLQIRETAAACDMVVGVSPPAQLEGAKKIRPHSTHGIGGAWRTCVEADHPTVAQLSAFYGAIVVLAKMEFRIRHHHHVTRHVVHRALHSPFCHGIHAIGSQPVAVGIQREFQRPRAGFDQATAPTDQAGNETVLKRRSGRIRHRSRCRRMSRSGWGHLQSV